MQDLGGSDKSKSRCVFGIDREKIKKLGRLSPNLAKPQNVTCYFRGTKQLKNKLKMENKTYIFEKQKSQHISLYNKIKLHRRFQDITIDFNMYSVEELKDEFDVSIKHLLSFREGIEQ